MCGGRLGRRGVRIWVRRVVLETSTTSGKWARCSRQWGTPRRRTRVRKNVCPTHARHTHTRCTHAPTNKQTNTARHCVCVFCVGHWGPICDGAPTRKSTHRSCRTQTTRCTRRRRQSHPSSHEHIYIHILHIRYIIGAQFIHGIGVVFGFWGRQTPTFTQNVPRVAPGAGTRGGDDWHTDRRYGGGTHLNAAHTQHAYVRMRVAWWDSLY